MRAAVSVRESSVNSESGRITPLLFTLSTLFIACLIAANIIAVKLVSIAGLVLPAAVVIFPITYIFGDVLTEVYGFRRARLVIWTGFVANLVVVGAIALAQLLPAASFWRGQAAYVQVLGQTPRILAGSFAAYLVGEFLNSMVLSRLKLVTRGRYLWTRTIGSTLVGQAADSSIFITIAFVGTVPHGELLTLIATQWLFKVAYEIAATPLTYLIVGFLKRREQIDAYDYRVSLNPFRLFDA